MRTLHTLISLKHVPTQHVARYVLVKWISTWKYSGLLWACCGLILGLIILRAFDVMLCRVGHSIKLLTVSSQPRSLPSALVQEYEASIDSR